jgi:glycine/D-amino acid oxidase-like deaminating enzyme
MMQTCDVAVIGGGIVGAACAYELASAGLRVTVVEPEEVVSGGTNLSYGSLAIVDDKPGQFELTRYGLRLWNELAEFLPDDCAYRRGGSIWIAADDTELEIAVRRAQRFNQQGIHAELLNSRRVAEAEPALRPRVAGGLYVADEGWCLAGRAAEFLLQLARQKGAGTIRQKALEIHNHEVCLEDETILYAGNIVNAAALGAATLTPGLPLTFAKVHLLVVETEAVCARHQILGIAPVADMQPDVSMRFQARQNTAGEVWIGSASQPAIASANLKVEPRVVAMLLRHAIDMIPAIGSARPLRSWAGVQCKAADGLPLIGSIPGQEGIFVATGHAGYGASAALATAKLIADEILSRTPEIDPNPYRADRFEGKA